MEVFNTYYECYTCLNVSSRNLQHAAESYFCSSAAITQAGESMGVNRLSKRPSGFMTAGELGIHGYRNQA